MTEVVCAHCGQVIKIEDELHIVYEGQYYHYKCWEEYSVNLEQEEETSQ